MSNLVLYSDGITSKWGFGDGDIIGDWLNDNDLELSGGSEKKLDEYFSVDEEHQLLTQLVKDYLLPILPHKIELTEMSTIHNPCRAVTIDGEEVDWYKGEYNLQPDMIEITRQQIESSAEKIGCKLVRSKYAR